MNFTTNHDKLTEELLQGVSDKDQAWDFGSWAVQFLTTPERTSDAGSTELALDSGFISDKS